MGLWTGKLLPGSFMGIPLFFESTEGPRQFDLAEHSPVGFVGSAQEPMGASARRFSCRLCFADSYFEMHKAVMAALDLSVMPGSAALLVHPVWGPQPVYPESYTPRVDFAAGEATIDVTFRRHDLVPETIVPLGVPIPLAFDLPSVPLGLGAYLLAIGFLIGWAIMAAVVAALRLITFGAALVIDGVGAVAERFGGASGDYGKTLARDVEPDPASGQTAPPPDAGVASAMKKLDRVTADFLGEMNVPVGVIDAVGAGGDYDAGPYRDGRPQRVGLAVPSPRTHAAMLVLGVLEAAVVGQVAAALGRELARRLNANAYDAASAASAVNAVRRRISRAMNLVDASMGDAGELIARALGAQAASLLRIVEAAGRATPAIETVTLTATRSLYGLALDLYGDVDRLDTLVERILALNGGLLDDENRIPAGTVLTVPATFGRAA